jgi:uncharacterized protein YuzE
MKITYFADTDTLFVEFRDATISDTRDLDTNTLADYGMDGEIVSITMEHASKRADLTSFSFNTPVAKAA